MVVPCGGSGGGGGWAVIVFAFGTQTVQGMQIGRQCHLLCYFSWDIAVSLQSKQMRCICISGACACARARGRARACACRCVLVFVACAPARCGRPFESATPTITNHMKG